jgi:hypothetical protein
LFAAGFGFLKLEFELFFALEVLLFEFFLEAGVKLIICCQKLEIFLVFGVSHLKFQNIYSNTKIIQSHTLIIISAADVLSNGLSAPI